MEFRCPVSRVPATGQAPWEWCVRWPLAGGCVEVGEDLGKVPWKGGGADAQIRRGGVIAALSSPLMRRAASGVGQSLPSSLLPPSPNSSRSTVSALEVGSRQADTSGIPILPPPRRPSEPAEVPGALAYILGKEGGRLQGRLGFHRSPPSAECSLPQKGRLPGSCEDGLVSLSVPTGAFWSERSPWRQSASLFREGCLSWPSVAG